MLTLADHVLWPVALVKSDVVEETSWTIHNIGILISNTRDEFIATRRVFVVSIWFVFAKSWKWIRCCWSQCCGCCSCWGGRCCCCCCCCRSCCGGCCCSCWGGRCCCSCRSCCCRGGGWWLCCLGCKNVNLKIKENILMASFNGNKFKTTKQNRDLKTNIIPSFVRYKNFKNEINKRSTNNERCFANKFKSSYTYSYALS